MDGHALSELRRAGAYRSRRNDRFSGRQSEAGASLDAAKRTGMALLVRMDKQLRLEGRRLVLLEPSDRVTRALKLMHLENFFLVASNILEARELIQPSS